MGQVIFISNQQDGTGGRRGPLHLWDFGGQDRFRFMLPSYVLGAKGALLLFDTTRVATLESLEEWVGICRTHDKNLPILLCGTKVDRLEDRSVSSEIAKSYLDSLKLFDYLEVSAKTGQNVQKVFETLASKMIRIREIDSLHKLSPLDFNYVDKDTKHDSE